MSSAPTARSSRPVELLSWRCDGDGDVDDGTGYATIDLDPVESGRSATWRVVHETCDPAPSARAHRVPIRELRTARATLKVTAYLLSELDWMRLTDWSRLLLNAAAQLPH